jgi:rare lipoprotein A
MRWLLLSLGVASIVLGCSTPERYSQRQDGTPVPIAPSRVQDAVVRADPLLPQGNKTPYTVRGKQYHVMASALGYKEEGIASWYGTKFHGHETSNGEIFDVYAATAAHKTLPLPSYARVTNLHNGQSIIVRVNDRGPFHDDRLIDLSYGAALRLGFADKGTAPVRVEAITPAGVDDRRQLASFGEYRNLQLGAFGDREAALSLRQRLANMIDTPLTVTVVDTPSGPLHRVRAGPFSSESALRRAQQRLQAAGFPAGQPLP